MAKLKNDVPSWIAVLVVALTIIYSSGGNVLAQQPVSQKPDTTAISNTQIKQSESDSTKTPAQSELSNNSSKPASFFAGIKEWANENQGVLELIALMLTVLGGIIAFFKIILPRIGRNKKDSAKKGSAQKRYLDHLINAHQHLPVAGFETNLRIPISLEKVYVTLRARLTDWERAGGEELRTLSSQASADRDLKVQEALKLALKKEYHGMVILGHPGSGKTTLTKYFTLCFATSQGEKNLGLPEKLLPVLLFLREIDPQKTLIENLLAVLHKYDLGLDENFFKTYLEKGEAIVLLDGLDEVPTEEKRARVSRWIHHKAHLAFPNCPLIVTSRFSGYRGDVVLKEGAYLRLDIQDFNLTEVRQFIVNWLTAVETHLHEDSNHWRTQAKIAAEDLFQRIDENPTLSDLAVNPLMLQIIALVHRDRGTLPDRRVELYKECTDVLLERWDKAKGLQVLLSAPQARQLLQPVALWMHSVENRREVSKAEVLDFIKPRIPPIKAGVDPEELLKSWRERNGIFKGEGDTYFFHHLSFQEYLTAEEIRNTGKVDILVKNFDHAWWREPTLLAMGLTNPPIFANFIEALLWANWRDGARVAFMLQCIDETLVKDESPFLKALRRLRRSEARLNALRGLQRIHSTQKEVKTVVKSVFEKDEDLFVRELARDLLAEWGEAPAPEAAETLTVIVRGKTRQLPPRINNLRELNAEYILIPGGKYRYSVTKEEVEVPPLYFAKYPLTNKLYRRFIDYLAEKETMREALHALPRQQFAASLLKKAEETKDFIEYLGSDPARWAEKLKSRYENEKRFNGGDQPVVAVTWFAATAYCLWLTELGKTRSEERGAKSEKLNYRLPQEEEWEWAAGGGKREYPWGNEPPDDTRANYGEKVGQTTPVGAYPARTTPEGLMDMAGNVWEWMENPYGVKEYPEARALRGGSWFSVDPVLRCSARSLRRPGSYWGYSGFRVVGCQS